MCVCVSGFPAAAYGPVAAAVAAARGSGRGARGRGSYVAYPQNPGPGKRSDHVCSVWLPLCPSSSALYTYTPQTREWPLLTILHKTTNDRFMFPFAVTSHLF